MSLEATSSQLPAQCRIASKGFTHSLRAKGRDELEDVTAYQVKLKAIEVSAIEPTERRGGESRQPPRPPGLSKRA